MIKKESCKKVLELKVVSKLEMQKFKCYERDAKLHLFLEGERQFTFNS